MLTNGHTKRSQSGVVVTPLFVTTVTVVTSSGHIDVTTQAPVIIDVFLDLKNGCDHAVTVSLVVTHVPPAFRRGHL
jgi:hypothetical protein|nr:MAG TPA: hypothetical protein [Caudoviricetes sp.]